MRAEGMAIHAEFWQAVSKCKVWSLVRLLLIRNLNKLGASNLCFLLFVIDSGGWKWKVRYFPTYIQYIHVKTTKVPSLPYILKYVHH